VTNRPAVMVFETDRFSSNSSVAGEDGLRVSVDESQLAFPGRAPPLPPPSQSVLLDVGGCFWSHHISLKQQHGLMSATTPVWPSVWCEPDPAGRGGPQADRRTGVGQRSTAWSRVRATLRW